MHIPYNVVPQISMAVMAGELNAAVVPLSTSVSSIKAGRLRALGVMSPKRSTALPEVPTIAEAGVAGAAPVAWHGWFVPARTPRAIIGVLQREAVKALNVPDVRDRLHGMGLEIVGSTPEEFEAKFKADLAVFAKIIKDARIPLQD
ncbi:MAG: hypothetical protein HYU75_18365 [Betaproteobacteria bacterium]|nr:hypothetical protein [Betaproteobacteria bacterium]